MRNERRSLAVALAVLGLVTIAAPARAADEAAAEAPAVALTTADLKGISTPSADDLAKGDPGGTLTGTAGDIVMADPKAGLTLADVVNQVGQNRIAINFVWTLVAGFLVMFMQAGFALVETGLCRAKNANHTMMMNFMVYGFGLFAYWVMGFAIQQGGSAGISNLGGMNPLNNEFKLSLFGKDWGLFGTKGFFLSGNTYDVGVMVLFLFQMVFMDTATTIVTGAAAERWKFAAFAISTFCLGAITYPLFGNWAWGGGWLSQLGVNFKLGHGYCDFAGSGVVHSVGGLTALAVAMIIGPRIGKYNRDGSPNAIPGHDITMVLLGCFILAFGWFGFNPGSTLGASGNGNLRIGSIAVNTMLAGCTGSFGAILYMWIRFGKPDASMSGNGLLAGLVAITAPSGFVNTVGSAIIGLSAGVLVCLSVEFLERVFKIDDPVGATSVHGTCGLYGVLCVGLFADGTSNYGGSWNGVDGSVRGLFYGDPGQFVAQLIGVCTLVGVIFTLSYVLNWFVDVFVGQRVSADAELEGLDLPEMGALGYPEFQLVTPGTGHSVDVGR
ncbi:MAG: ammonium transporter [Deltaproteobacteria bacterium]|nr:MAG: ammonium transporter [Deltaproteobacteria bacterium]TMB24845.1 MAG: ammonium transporter [Deltaproteobacteria bacterium]